MRISLLLIFCCTSVLFAENTYSQRARVTIKQRNVQLETVLNQIEKQTDYLFLYNGNQIDVNRTVNVNVENKPVNELLTSLFTGTPVRYAMEGTHIILMTGGEQASAVQQSVPVTGLVVDASGEPMPGVNVIVKGTTTGIVTDVDGGFSINVPNEQAVLVFSFVGFVSQELAVGSNRRMDITLEEDTQQIEEVVVVGYGVQKRASVTGSVSSIQSKDLVSVKSANVTNTLAGKLPGLRAVQRSGAPGDDAASVDIRGFGSALVIVDGVQRDFTQIDANDIESISILKDASAAVYGFKGANGVILVTTKKGAQGRPKVTYNGYYGIQNVTRFPDFYNAYEYATLQNEGQLNIGGTAPYSLDAVEKYRLGNDPAYPSTDWWKEATRKNAPQMYHSLGVSGGNERVSYFVSLGYTRQEGIWVSRDHVFERYNVRSNLSAKITDNLTVDLQLAGRLDNRNRQYIDRDNARTIMMAHPNLPVYANNTEPYWQDTGDNPNPVQVAYKDEIGYDDREREEFVGSLGVNWEIPWVKGLKAKAMVSYDYNGTFGKKWYKEFYEYTYNESKKQYDKTIRHSLSTMDEKYERRYVPNQQYSLNYQRTFGKHDVNALALFELRKDRKDWFSLYREFSVSAIDQAGAGDKTNMRNDGTATEETAAGLVGRLNYAYAGKYLAEASFRYDGSSWFRSDEQWGFFPAVSLGWRISDEFFIKDNFSFVNNFKFRGSYGVTGDNTDFKDTDKKDLYDPDVFRSGYIYPTVDKDNNYLPYVLGTGGLTNGASDKGVPNMLLTWYTVKIANFGFEGTFWNGLLSMEFDYFIRHRDGLGAKRNLSLPTSSGLVLPVENLNSDKTRGFEMVLGHRNHIGDFTYDVKANFTSTRTLNEYLEQAAPSNMYTNWRNNKSDRYNNIEWGYEYLGQFQTFEEILNSPIQDANGNKSLLPGDYKYADLNGDGMIDSSDEIPVSHNEVPTMYYGLNLYMSYKGFDLTMFLQGAAGHEIAAGAIFTQPFIQEGLGNGTTVWLDRWRRADPYDVNSEWIAGDMPAIRPGSFSNNEKRSSKNILNETYLRLKTIELGYTFPKEWMQRVKIENMRIYVNGFNTLTFTKGGLMKYMDPENKEGGMHYYPQVKTFNVGLNLTF